MHKISGVHTAIITPFHQDGSLNEDALLQNIRFQMQNKIDGLVVLGTTAEAPTLTEEEMNRIIKLTIQQRDANNKTCLITIGTGSYCTRTTIEKTKKAKDLGADAALIVVPYYNKPTQSGLYQHFKAVAEAVDIPIIVYNIAGRTGQNLETKTLQDLSAIPNIVAVKEASGNILQMMDVYLKIVETRPDFCLLSGDDALTMPLMAVGGHGVISVVSNLVPDLIKTLVTHLQNGEFMEAKKLHYQLLPLFKGCFIETNPIPIKTAMNHFGMDAGPCRLPLSELLPENKKSLIEILNTFEFCHLGKI